MGPIDYLALEFPEARMNGEGLAAILDLVDRGLVRILDLRAVKREADGTFTEIEIADFDSDGTLDLAVFRGESRRDCWMTTISAKRPLSLSQERLSRCWSGRTPGRLPSSQP